MFSFLLPINHYMYSKELMAMTSFSMECVLEAIQWVMQVCFLRNPAIPFI